MGNVEVVLIIAQHQYPVYVAELSKELRVKVEFRPKQIYEHAHAFAFY